MAGSVAISRVRRPLPTITASASHAKDSGAWRSTRTPLPEATTGSGETISACQPGRLTRLRIAEAMKESSSLKPSKVRIAMRMTGSPDRTGQASPARTQRRVQT